jgi:hypothetical protein
MSEQVNQWAPGPWSVRGNFIVAHHSTLHGEQAIASMANWFPASHSANARLIAAAPELVEALDQYMRIGFGNSLNHEAQVAAYNNATTLLNRIRSAQ